MDDLLQMITPSAEGFESLNVKSSDAFFFGLVNRDELGRFDKRAKVKRNACAQHPPQPNGAQSPRHRRGDWGGRPALSRRTNINRSTCPLLSETWMLCSRQQRRRARSLSEAVRQELLVDLARFLGATSRVWTSTRRRHLETLLIDAGLSAVGPSCRTVGGTPREEVVDAAVNVFAGIVEKHDGAAGAFVEALTSPPTGITSMPIVREVMLRSLVRGECPDVDGAELRVAYQLAALDVSPSVRDAAAQTLSSFGRRDGGEAELVLGLLRRLKDDERDHLVLESIDEAIEAVSDKYEGGPCSVAPR
jgi:hypothetical protein